MAGSNRYINATAFSWAPLPSGVAINVDGVTQVAIDPGAKSVMFKGDGDTHASFKAVIENDPRISVRAANVLALLTIPQGVAGTVNFLLNHAKTRAGSGAIAFTATNCMRVDNSISMPHGGFAEGATTFETYSTDGVTSPISYSVVV